MSEHITPTPGYAYPRCIGGEAHFFQDLSMQTEQTTKKHAMVGWAWCNKCGSTLEIYADQGEPAVITRPRIAAREW